MKPNSRELKFNTPEKNEDGLNGWMSARWRAVRGSESAAVRLPEERRGEAPVSGGDYGF